MKYAQQGVGDTEKFDFEKRLIKVMIRERNHGIIFLIYALYIRKKSHMKAGVYMTTLLDIVKAREESDKFGMKIHLKLPRTDLVDFRITYGNLFCYTNEEGVGVATKDKIKNYSGEMRQQLVDAGYYVVEPDIIWTDDCYDIFLRKSDAKKDFPRMQVYVHPNEISGWAPKKELNKLIEIANNNSCTSNVQLVYTRKVYIMDDEKYLSILKEAEPEIVEWVKQYRKYYKGRYDASEVFENIFGINRVQVEHLSYKDPILRKYIRSLTINGIGI